MAVPSAGCGIDHYALGTTIDQIDTDAGPRGFRVHVPRGYNGLRPTPLVLNFHGYAQDALEQESYSGLVPLSDEDGFILVTPEGSGSPEGWNIAGVYNEDGVDDVLFVTQLVGRLSNALCLDPNRIYATGHSNGAEMASELACDVPALLAAIAPVSGALYQGCEGTGTPVIAFQGTDDYNVYYEWSQEAVDEWVAHNGCQPAPDEVMVATNVLRQSWGSCGGGDVVFYTIEGGGHTWPGADPGLGGVGETTDEINASALMWAFFQAHPKRS
jgi:polyhydroxybutyrate depolymerase